MESFLQFGIRLKSLGRHVTEVKRSAPQNSGVNRVKVFCVVRNGAPYLKPFLEHYRSLGSVEFIFMVNDSSDDTEEQLLSEQDTTVLRSTAPYRKYENSMKRWLVDNYGADSWCIFADVDEHLDYAGSETRSVNELVDYLDARGATAVITQMLDMYPSVPASDWNSDNETDFRDSHHYYELATIESRMYIEMWRFKNVYPEAFRNGSIVYHRLGVRWRVFKTENGLTKVSLFKNDASIRTFVKWHHCTGGHFADFSCALLHYPFASGFHEKVRDAVATGRYGRVTTIEYIGYHRAMSNPENVSLMNEASLRYENTWKLATEGFLHLSPDYTQWARPTGLSDRREPTSAATRGLCQ